MPEFITSAIQYAKDNLLFVGVIAACVLLILIVTIALIAKCCKNKKARKLAEKAAATVIADTAAEPTPAPETAKEEPKTEMKEEAKPEPIEPIKEEPKEQVKETPKAETPVKKETPNAKEKPVTAKKPAPKKVAEEKPAPKKSVAEQPAPQKTVEEKPAPKKSSGRYTGKWVICHLIIEDKNGTPKEEAYFFELRASNGELLLSSEEYTSQSGAAAGIETHKANIKKDNFKITLSKKGDYIFKLLNGKRTLLCTGANYPTIQRAESAVESTKRFAKTAILQESVEELHITVPDEEEETPPEYDESIVGKWIINTKSDDSGNSVYYFELFASNGEKLLSSEEYTTYVGAVNGIATHKTNIEKDNFRISLTKRGQYIFKLLSGNGQLLCLGEHYKTKTRCENAVESVKRFAKSSPVLASSDLTE